jgi:hypothetical protein
MHSNTFSKSRVARGSIPVDGPHPTVGTRPSTSSIHPSTPEAVETRKGQSSERRRAPPPFLAPDLRRSKAGRRCFRTFLAFLRPGFSSCWGWVCVCWGGGGAEICGWILGADLLVFFLWNSSILDMNFVDLSSFDVRVTVSW